MEQNEIKIDFVHVNNILVMTLEGSLQQTKHIMTVHPEAIPKVFHLKYKNYQLPDELYKKYRNGKDIPRRLDVDPVIYPRLDFIKDSSRNIQITINAKMDFLYLRLLDTVLLWEGLQEMLID